MDVKYLLIDNAYYEYHLLQQKLSRMAADGWELEKAGNIFWKFRRSYPQQVRYEIIFSSAASAFNSRPTEAEEELAELCAQAGWERVTSVAQLQIYRNPDPNATPLETDEVQKLENIRRTMRKHFIPQQLLMIVLFIFQFLMHGSTAMLHPTRTLSSMLMVTTLAMLLGIVLIYAILLIDNLLWLRRARAEVGEGRPIPVNGFYRKFRWVVWAMLAVYLTALLFWVEPMFTVMVLIISVILIGTTLGTIHLCKQMNAPRWVNITVPVVTGTLVVMFATGLFVAAMDSIIFSDELPRAESLPLTLTQLTGETGTERTMPDDQRTPLVGYQRCWDTGEKERLTYTIVDVSCPMFYDVILGEQERSYMEAGWLSKEALTDEQREIVGADYIRRCTSANYDRWFICWEDRIVTLRASWELTDEQLALVAQALRP